MGLRLARTQVATAPRATSRSSRSPPSSCIHRAGVPCRYTACRSLCDRLSGRPGFRFSEFLRNADKEHAARPELRRKHTDAGAVPDLVDLVEQVDDIEPHRRWLVRRKDVEIMRHPDIDLGIGRQVIGIGKALSL